MDLFFNELSIRDQDSLNYDTVVAIAGVYKELRNKRITTCRIAPEDNMKLFCMLGNLPESFNVRNFYFSFFRSPYESEAVEKKQGDYYGHSWSYDGEECFGFALAFLLDSASFSIYGTQWNTPFIRFQIDGQPEDVRNISVKEHVSIHISQLQDETMELVKCDIPISDKKIVLRQDHGMDVLKEYAKRLVRCPYVVEIVNSLSYHPHERKFIRKIRENGLIEIVLPWTDARLGLVVRTTGRTIRETQKIAQVIEQEFCYI